MSEEDLARGSGPCPYCGLPREDMGNCVAGFPGCARSDAIWHGAVSVHEARPSLETENAELRAENARLRASLAARQQDIAALQAASRGTIADSKYAYGVGGLSRYEKAAAAYVASLAALSAPVDDHDVA